MSDPKDLIDAIDQLDAEFSGALNDICISKAEVMSVIWAHFGEPIAAARGVDPSEREKFLHRKLDP